MKESTTKEWLADILLGLVSGFIAQRDTGRPLEVALREYERHPSDGDDCLSDPEHEAVQWVLRFGGRDNDPRRALKALQGDREEAESAGGRLPKSRPRVEAVLERWCLEAKTGTG